MKLQFKRSLVERIMKAVLLASNKVNKDMNDKTLDKTYNETVQLAGYLRKSKNTLPEAKRYQKREGIYNPIRKKVNMKEKVEVIVDNRSWKEIKEQRKNEIKRSNRSNNMNYIR